MAVKADIQYIQYRVDGNTARKVECGTEGNFAAPVYTPRPTKARVIAVDPIAVFGIVLAVVMLVSMAAGLLQYRAVLERNRVMSQYVQQLEAENTRLSEEYHNGYDADEIRDIALAAGMVPVEDVETIHVSVAQPVEDEHQMSFWQTLTVFLARIFA